MELYIEHHGILGQKWGVRRYQNSDGTLTPAGRKHIQRLEKKDEKWATKNYTKIQNKAYKRSARELAKYDKQLRRQMQSGMTFVNSHNQKMAELMTKNISDVSSPSGRAVKFVAKRGELGVHLALADRNYDMSQLKNGIWGDGRIAYKKQNVNVSSELKHYGVLGMHWGIRNDSPMHLRTGQMPTDEYARACDLWNKTKEFPGISGREKERVYEELDNNLSDEEREFSVVKRRIDNYLYTAINKGHNQYKIIDRKRKESPRNLDEWYDDIFTEVIGPDWRKYDY